MRKARLIFAIATALLFGKLSAQQTSEIKMTNARLSELSVEVEVMGNIATTTLDMIFVNDTNRILEGELEFPLGEGETVTGYALDINGKMRQGVVVEKDKGRQVFEAIVRQGVDPGLIEKTSGNNFKTRVYPLPAKGSRHVQITYQSRLWKADAIGSASGATSTNGAVSAATAVADRKCIYSALPSGKLDSFSFRITVLKPQNQTNATLSQNSNGIQSFSFADSSSGYTGSISQKNVTLTKPFEFVIPESMLTGGANTAGANGSSIPVFTQDIGKDTYFYCFLPINGTEQPKVLPKKLTVWWDISGSGSNRNLDAELNFLLEYIKKLNKPVVTVYPFCNELHEARTFTINSELDITSLEKFIRSLEYDGATNLGYDFTSFGGDEVLLFSDGISNWTDPATTTTTHGLSSGASAPAAVYTINSSTSADHAWLSSTAQKNGGQYINLCTATINDALKTMTSSPYRLIKAEYDKTAVSEIYPENGTTVKSDFELSGLLKKKEAVITLSFGHGNNIEKTVKVNLKLNETVTSSHVARQWASMKIDALSADYEGNKQEITELAKKFGIVTNDTSLIVLDTVQDYVRYGIVPPDELKEEYNRLVSSNNSTFKPQPTDDDKTIPASVYKLFEDFRSWWNTTPEEFKAKKQAAKNTTVTTGSALRMAEAAPPASAFVYDDFEDAAVVYESFMAEEPAVAMDTNDIAAAPASANTANGASGNSQPSIQLQAWSPDQEYLSILKRTPTAQMYDKYLELKKDYSSSPSFYMEVSDYFAEEELYYESIRILSNLAELKLENTDILRALANKLMEHKHYALAVPVFEKLVALKPEIPQFYRDLGMAYSLAGQKQKAVDTLYSVAYRKWDNRFAEVQQIALNDMNAIIAECQRNGITLDTSNIDKKLIQNFDVDVRVILTWNTDDCDIDLWVTDKDGEKCYYGNRLTANGGRLSRDFTQGYGPEEFCIHTSPGGKFTIQANYYANHQQKILQPVTVQAEVYTNFGRENQKREVLTLELKDNKEVFLIGTIE
ncbi:MAG: DUF2135 domain-containing protein [Spirochaetaceae bacterium]|nr:DUF2135 domain-containing protein [Spirochaetaceae bacterium]